MDVVGSIAEARPTLSDTIVLAVKSQDAEAAIAAIAWVALDDGRGVVADLPILTLQNGLATEDIALRRFDRVIGVSIGIPASHLEPGRDRLAGATGRSGSRGSAAIRASLPGEEERHRAAFAAPGSARTSSPTSRPPSAASSSQICATSSTSSRRRSKTPSSPSDCSRTRRAPCSPTPDSRSRRRPGTPRPSSSATFPVTSRGTCRRGRASHAGRRAKSTT